MRRVFRIPQNFTKASCSEQKHFSGLSRWLFEPPDADAQGSDTRFRRPTQTHEGESDRALLDGLLGGGNGDSSSSTDLGTVIGTNPQLGVHASDILHSEDGGSGGDSFTGIGDIGLGFAAPTVVGLNLSSDQMSSDNGNGDGGGLLGGLL